MPKFSIQVELNSQKDKQSRKITAGLADRWRQEQNLNVQFRHLHSCDFLIIQIRANVFFAAIWKNNGQQHSCRTAFLSVPLPVWQQIKCLTLKNIRLHDSSVQTSSTRNSQRILCTTSQNGPIKRRNKIKRGQKRHPREIT